MIKGRCEPLVIMFSPFCGKHSAETSLQLSKHQQKTGVEDWKSTEKLCFNNQKQVLCSVLRL